MQHAAGMEAVGVGGDAAHRVQRDRAADHLGMFAAPGIGPALRDSDFLLERDVGDFCGDTLNRRRIDAALGRHGVGCVFVRKKALSEQLERRHRLAAVGEHEFTDDERRNALTESAHEFIALSPKRLLRLGERVG